MRRGAALTLIALLLGASALGSAGPAAADPNAKDCKLPGGTALPALWPEQRLRFDRAWSITRGGGLLVAVIDSGLNTAYSPHLRDLSLHAGVDVIPFKGFSPTNTDDCYGHGTAVTSILAGQPSGGDSFEGVAPDVRIMPIKQTHQQGDGSGTSESLGTAIDKAVAAGARVINVSITTPASTRQLEDAVRGAAAKDVVIVAAAGNDGDSNNRGPAYPAAYSTTYSNVIAVSASDSKDDVPQFSNSGSYVTVAAPGVDVPATSAIDDKYLSATGTSFATPFVAGTAALIRAAYPKLTAAQVRARIIATADVPPAKVPDARYGYGIVNPYLAVSSVPGLQDASASTRPAAPLPAPAAAVAPDRGVQNQALGVSAALAGLAVLAVIARAVLRSHGRRRAV